MIDQQIAKDIVSRSEFPDGFEKQLAAGPKEKRLVLIRKKYDSQERRVAAAIEIQRNYRGYCARCHLTSILHADTSNTAVYSKSKPYLQRIEDARTPTPTKRRQGPNGRERLDAYYQNYINKMLGMGVPSASPDIISFEDFCANYIQNWWKKCIDQQNRKHGISVTTSVSGKSGSKVSGSKVSGSKVSKRPVRIPKNTNEAASVIQKAWRRHIDVQVYRYYKDLINFRQRGDPAMMLRCINPKEAKYMDAAAGIHIKFRLAGERFPPNIYYKIYTHHAVQDLCANSPKDYTRANVKFQMARDVHNKPKNKKVTAPKQDAVGWYERIENNGWRLVSDRLIHNALSDPVTWDTSRKKVEFHHNKLQRKDDVEKKKRKKKIEWMQKMYKQGMLKAKAEDAETISLIDGAAAGMVSAVDTHGPAAVQDWEVDELLDWTTSLNFDDYWSSWKELATSSTSKKAVEERLGLHPGMADPFELQLNGSISKQEGSTRPSHNSPASTHTPATMNYHY